MIKNNCKIALVGAGKTGHRVSELYPSELLTIYTSKNPPSLADLSKCDVVLSFLPGHVFEQYLDLFFDCAKPIVSGSTGHQYPDGFVQMLAIEKRRWVESTNFALGMSVVHQMIELIKNHKDFFAPYDIAINEIHHTKKMDAPSGTAISWSEWADVPKDIVTSERIGDEIGTHTLSITGPSERITIEHNSLNRDVFARGAIWACEHLLEIQDQLPFGLIPFSQIARRNGDIS
jgi:4-hydroxy-tetrahydrodipicolinate reductase